MTLTLDKLKKKKDAEARRASHPASKPIGGYIKELPFLAIVWNANGDEVERHELDFSDTEDKKWLTRLTVWAFINGYTIENMTIESAKADNLI